MLPEAFDPTFPATVSSRLKICALLLCSCCFACAGPSVDEVQGTGVEFLASERELGVVEHSGGGVTPFEVGADRDRSAVQIEVGTSAAAVLVQVFREDWNYQGSPTYPLDGVLVGARGIQFVGDFDETEISLVLPWRVDASFAAGTQHEGGLIDEFGYAELRGELGLGVNWNGLRLSLGASLSSIDGNGTFDSPQFGMGAASVRRLDVSAQNLGLFLDVRYQPPKLPIYGNVRVSGVDDSGTAFGLGIRF